MNRKKNLKFSEDIRSFALTLNFYSAKAYNYVRRIWKNLLPHPTTLRKWYSVVDGSPGFTKQAFTSIKCANKKKQIIVNIVIDEMSIRQQAIYTNGQFFGQVNLGTSINEVSDNPVLARYALVFMAVALNSYWKIPLGYFLIDGLNGAERANLLRTCLELLHETGAKTYSITFDGAPCNINMCTEMGACFSYNDKFKPWFTNPITNEKIFVFYDMCHMTKLVRNALAEKGIIKYNSERINWNYIRQLYEVQQEEGLNCATKLTNKHVFFQNNKMNVKLAVQVLSRSTSKALLFMQKLCRNEFKDCSATADFCLIMNNAFDLLNVKSKFCKSLSRTSLNSETYDNLFEESKKIIKYILSLKDLQDLPITTGPRKIGFIGIIINLTNLFELFLTVKTKLIWHTLFHSNYHRIFWKHFFLQLEAEEDLTIILMQDSLYQLIRDF